MRLPTLFPTIALAAAVALGAPAAAAPAAAAGAPHGSAAKADVIRVEMNGTDYELEAAPYAANGAVYLPVRDMGELLGAVVFWNGIARTVTMTYPGLTLKLTDGSMQATVNGKAVALTSPLQTVNGRIYAPLRFFSESTGAGVEWKSASRTVSITRPDAYIKGIGVNTTLWLNRGTGDLYYAHPYEQAPAHVGRLETEGGFKGGISMTVGGFGTNSTVITVVDNYGEPHVHYDEYSVLVHGKQAVSQRKASYFQRYEPNVNYYQYYHPDGWIQNLALTDGRTLTVFNEEGAVEAEYDLPALAGKDEAYAVLGISDKYLVVRPNRTGFLTLINLDDGNRAVELYDKLLTGEDLAYARDNDVPYRGDSLIFAGGTWQGDRLTFLYDSPFDGKNDYEELHYDRQVDGSGGE